MANKHVSLDETVSGLNRDLASLGRIVKQYNKAKVDPIANYFRMVTLLHSAELIYRKMSATCSIASAETWLVSERGSTQANQREFAAKFGKALADRLSASNFAFEGTYPTFKSKFFTLEISELEGKLTLWYGNKEEKLATIQPVDVDAVAKKVVSEHQRITHERYSSIERLLSSLWHIYKASLDRQQKPLGNSLELILVLKELNIMRQSDEFWRDPRGKEFKAYTREEFSYDMSKLLGSNRTIDGWTLQLSTATREQDKNRGKYLWIPTGETQGYVYAAMMFRKSDNVTT